MSSVAGEAGRAAQLLAFAIQPKVARGASQRYNDLWLAYRTDDVFRDVVEAIADGLGLVVLAVTDQALVVTAASQSPFAFRIADYRAGMGPTDRMLVGLAHLGIAAVAYPRETDLEDDLVVRRSPHRVEQFLRDACQKLAEAEYLDPTATVTEGDSIVWREFLAMPSVRRLDKGGYSRDCTMGIITRAFGWLVEQGMARPSGDNFQLLDRYRVQIREFAGNEALLRLRGATDSAAYSAIDEPEPSIPSSVSVDMPLATNDADGRH